MSWQDSELLEDIAARSSKKPVPIKRQLPPEPFHWLKYGEKLLRDRKTVRTYYRCSLKGETGCEAKKMVDVVGDLPATTSTHYRESHNHPCGTRSTSHQRQIAPRTEAFGPLTPQQSLLPKASDASVLDSQRRLRSSDTEELASVYAAAVMERDLMMKHQLLPPSVLGAEAERPSTPAETAHPLEGAFAPRGTAEALLLEHLLKLHLQSSSLKTMSGRQGQIHFPPSLQQVSLSTEQGPLDIFAPRSGALDSGRGWSGNVPNSAAGEALEARMRPMKRFSEDVDEEERAKRARPGDAIPYLGITGHASEDNQQRRRLQLSSDIALHHETSMDPRKQQWISQIVEAENSQGSAASTSGGGRTAMHQLAKEPSLEGLRCTHEGCSWLRLGDCTRSCSCFFV